MDTGEDEPGWVSKISSLPSLPKSPSKQRDWMDLLNDANSYLSLHLVFAYLFTFLALRFVYKNYARFVRARQLFSLELVHSIAARTVMVTELPNHLCGERALAVYFENIGLTVESVSVVREVAALKDLLDRRTEALMKLERAWTDYLGNPSTAEIMVDPSAIPPLIDIEGEPNRNAHGTIIVPNKKRTTLRPRWFAPKVDALEYLETQFKEADQAVQQWRKSGKFRASRVAFVTFEKMSSAVCKS